MTTANQMAQLQAASTFAAIESQMYLPFFLLHLVLHSPSFPFAHLAVQIVYFLPFDVQSERTDPAGGLQPKIQLILTSRVRT